MNAKELAVINEAAEHLMRGLASSTRKTYLEQLSLWMRFMGRRTLRAYDAEGAKAWFEWLASRSGAKVGRNRHAIFPLRCVELAQQVSGLVSDEFAIPYALWQAKEIRYRDAAMPEERVTRLMGICEREIASASGPLTRDTLMSFAVLLAMRTGMNAESLTWLRRDCLVPCDGGARLHWYKGRSGGVMQSFHRPSRWGVIEIIGRLRELGSDPEYLMTASDTRSRPVRLDSKLLAEWRRKRSLPPFTLMEIRPAMATLIFNRSDGNVSEVQRFLQHRSPATTILYLEANVVRPVVERQVAAAIDSIYAQITGGGLR